MKKLVKVSIISSNTDRMIKRIIKDKINIIALEKMSKNEVNIIIEYEDYKRIKKYKTVSKIVLKDKYGVLKVKKNIIQNKYLLSFLFLGIALLVVLSNVIFKVKIVHSNSGLRNVVYKELEKYKISKYRLVKSEEYINKIEKEILDNNKNLIEWIEIVRQGTTYIVKLQERKLNKTDNVNYYRNIVASKNAIITSINSSKGEKIKNINDYVEKGDIIISKDLIKPDGSTLETKVIGTVYGDVWYTVTCQIPYEYSERKLTGREKKVLVINILNKKINIPTYKSFKTYSLKNKTIFKDNLSLISVNIEKQYEIENIKYKYNEKNISDKAINISQKKLLDTNKKIKEFKKFMILNIKEYESYMEIKLFVTTNEEIGKYE